MDFADVRSIMNDAGTAMMGIVRCTDRTQLFSCSLSHFPTQGIGSGKTAAADAAAAAISSPLLDTTIQNAKGVVFNISGGPNLSLNEVNQAAKLIYSTVEADANVIFGALVDDTLEDNISITVLATGFAEGGREASMQAVKERMTPKKSAFDDLNDVRRRAAPKRPEEEAPAPARSTSLPSEDKKIPAFLKNLKKRQ